MDTKINAISKSMQEWDWVAEGNSKESWPMWARNEGIYYNVQHDCFLCQYTMDMAKEKEGLSWNPTAPYVNFCLKYCPYAIHFGYQCTDSRSPFSRWEEFSQGFHGDEENYDDEDAIKAATLFRNELENILMSEICKQKTTLVKRFVDITHEVTISIIKAINGIDDVIELKYEGDHICYIDINVMSGKLTDFHPYAVYVTNNERINILKELEVYEVE